VQEPNADEIGAKMSTATGRPASPPNLRAILVVTCLALATVVAANASLNVALPSIARATHASQVTLEWIIDAYALVFAALLLPAGAIGDRFGRRRVLLTGLAIFGTASFGATLVSSAPALIALRAVIGVGAALVMPATLSTITATFPIAARGRAVSVWAGVAGASAIVGLLSSGALLEAFSWRSVFGLNVVLAGAAFIATLRVVPESVEDRRQPLDVRGSAIAVTGLVVLVYSLIEAPDRGWASTRTLGGLLLAGLILAGFVGWELRAKHPLLDPRLFGNRAFSAGTLSVTVQFFAFFGFIFAMLQYLQIVRGDSALIAAVSVLPVSAGLLPGARLAPMLAARIGTRSVWVAGLTLAGAGLLVLSELSAGSPYWIIVAGLLPLGFGMGLAMTPATTAITEALPLDKQGVGSAMNDLSREFGGALGIAVIGSVLAGGYRTHLHLPGVAPALADHARSSLAVATRLGPDVAVRARGAFVDGMHPALLCGAVAAWVAALAVAFLIGRDRHPGRTSETTANPVVPHPERLPSGNRT
jgi:EmrB/QacA subfamily drug resistance transporter